MQTKLIEIQTETATVYFLGDIHEGAANHQAKALAKAIDIIANDSNAYWIGMGDYIDAINHRDPRFNPLEMAQEYNIKDLADLPKRQCQKLADKLKPIAHQCLGLISGNHEDSLRRHSTFDPTEYLAELLNTESLGGKGWVILRFLRAKEHGKDAVETYRICVAHGTGGGGMREGYPINKAYDMFRWDVADVCVMGHIHKMQTDKAEFMSCDYNTIRIKRAWYGTNGCFLSKSEIGTDGYFEQKPGKPSDIGMLKYTIKTKIRDKSTATTSLEKIYL